MRLHTSYHPALTHLQAQASAPWLLMLCVGWSKMAWSKMLRQILVGLTLL
jgi:hypothetical protein